MNMFANPSRRTIVKFHAMWLVFIVLHYASNCVYLSRAVCGRSTVNYGINISSIRLLCIKNRISLCHGGGYTHSATMLPTGSGWIVAVRKQSGLDVAFRQTANVFIFYGM
jgi:hypothetical protein